MRAALYIDVNPVPNWGTDSRGSASVITLESTCCLEPSVAIDHRRLAQGREKYSVHRLADEFGRFPLIVF